MRQIVRVIPVLKSKSPNIFQRNCKLRSVGVNKSQQVKPTVLQALYYSFLNELRVFAPTHPVLHCVLHSMALQHQPKQFKNYSFNKGNISSGGIDAKASFDVLYVFPHFNLCINNLHQFFLCICLHTFSYFHCTFFYFPCTNFTTSQCVFCNFGVCCCVTAATITIITVT